jgi:hypothetical protein
MTTGKEMCELISKWLKDTGHPEHTPEEIWNYSPTGELSLVFELYGVAKKYYAEKDHQ